MAQTGRVADPAVPRDDSDVDPPYLYPDYEATRLRAPERPPIWLPRSGTESSGPVLGRERVRSGENDLTRQHDGEPIGERIVVSGRVVDSDGRPVRDTLLEIWQANAAGRYAHRWDDHDAPLDPNFSGLGRTVTDHEGAYFFTTIKPGPYPWKNHDNAWRPAHIHFSLFGEELPQRLVTQMYFVGDPLFFQDPIWNSIPDERARQSLIAQLDMAETEPEMWIGYHFDIVLRGRGQTFFERNHA